jgi:hypothetical protein
LLGLAAANNIPSNNENHFPYSPAMISDATHNTLGELSTSKSIIIINKKNCIK